MRYFQFGQGWIAVEDNAQPPVDRVTGVPLTEITEAEATSHLADLGTAAAADAATADAARSAAHAAAIVSRKALLVAAGLTSGQADAVLGSIADPDMTSTTT